MMRTVIAVAGIIAYWLIAACQRSTRVPAAASPPPRDTETAMVSAVRDMERLDGAAMWPGFDPHSIVVVVASPTRRFIVIGGDVTARPEFSPIADDPRVTVRRGAVPDSLARLRVPFTWEKRPLAATVVQYTGDMTFFVLLHESVHVMQYRRHRANPPLFSGTFSPAFPTASVEATTYALVEGSFLADALRAGRVDERNRFIAGALRAAAEECRVVGAAECETERGTEVEEGLADLVAWRGMAATGRATTSAGLDSVHVGLTKIVTPAAFQRPFFYKTGMAMLVLLDRLDAPDWRRRVESTAPEELLRLAVDTTSNSRDMADFRRRFVEMRTRAEQLVAAAGKEAR